MNDEPVYLRCYKCKEIIMRIDRVVGGMKHKDDKALCVTCTVKASRLKVEGLQR